MRRIIKVLFVIVLLPSVPAIAEIQDRAQMLIEQMGARAKTLNYKGYFTFERGSQSTSYFVAHFVENGEQTQRLFFMDGPEREVLVNKHKVNCLHPGDKSKRPGYGDVRALLSLTKPRADLWEFYQADIVGKERVANRQTTKIVLKPKDRHRYPFVFFVDNITGLMLKMLILDQQGFPLERFHYVTIDYDSVTPEDVIPQYEGHHVVEHNDVDSTDSKLNEKKWQLRWLPDGFVEEKLAMNNWQNKQYDESHMYTDGVSAFSLFIEQVATPETGKRGVSKQLGSMSAVSHYVHAQGQVYLVTVIGEIPVTTARQIASSVRLQP